MEPVPISRSALQQLKAKTDEENRKKQVKKAATILYREVLRIATTSSETSRKFQLQKTAPGIAVLASRSPMDLHPNDMNFILDNQADILQELRSLFPDSVVGIKTLSKAADGNFYDVSTLDENLLKFVDRRYDQTCLVVDWS